MPGRNKPLITRNGIPDPQAYNPQTGQWESFIGVSWGKTAGGLYVPIRVDDQGRQEVTLSGTIVGIEVTRPSSIALEPGQKIYEPVVDFRDEMFALSYSLRHVAEGGTYTKPVLKWSCAIQNNFDGFEVVQELEHEELIDLESKVTKTTKKIFPVGRYGRLMIENKDDTKTVMIYRVTCTKYRA